MQATDDYVNLAEEAWNEAAPIHWRVTQALIEEIKDPGRRDIHQIQIDELERIGVKGARVAHLNCNARKIPSDSILRRDSWDRPQP
jgi:hypothetical protein